MAVKITIVLLLLIAVAFFFTMSEGARHNDSQKLPDGDADRANYAQTHPPPAWIGKFIGPLSPKLSLPQKEFRFGANGLDAHVPAASPRFRNAVLRVTSGCRAPEDCSNVEVSYTSENGEGRDLKLNTQGWQPSKDKPSEASLVIMQGGGTISFRCTIVAACTVELQ